MNHYYPFLCENVVQNHQFLSRKLTTRYLQFVVMALIVLVCHISLISDSYQILTLLRVHLKSCRPHQGISLG